MVTKRVLRRRHLVKHHTQAERDEILVRFRSAVGEGRSAAEVAKGLGASLASIYRWRRAQSTDFASPPPTRRQALDINTAISRLCDKDNDDRQSFLEAFFKFVAWLRWPTSPGDHPAAITACVVAYLSHGLHNETLDELPGNDLKLLLGHIRVDTLRRLCTEQAFNLPIFELWDIYNQPYKETDFLAEVAHFLLAFDPISQDHRDAPSLKKAYYASQSAIFRYRWPMVESTFRKYWLQYGSAAPFLYVERFHSSLNFELNPIEPVFAECVEETLRQKDDLRRYFSRCRAIVNLLISRLDARAVDGLRFPSFPHDLVPEAVVPPPLPSRTHEVMREFGRRDKRR